jgi:hypothetical protein
VAGRKDDLQMQAHVVAGHLLAKIDAIVQSGDLAKNQQDTSTYTSAKLALEGYCVALDAVTRYAAVEPGEASEKTEELSKYKRLIYGRLAP